MRFLILTFNLLCIRCFVDAYTIDWLPTNEDIIDYIIGMKVPPFNASLRLPPMRMNYQLKNTVIGHTSPSDSGATGSYEIDGDVIRIRFKIPEGFITGYMKSMITRTDVPNFKYPMEGNFTIHAVNSTIDIVVLFPKIGSKTSPLVMTECEAKYDKIVIDLDAKSIEDSLDMVAMNHWLSRAMHETLSDLYCIAIRADVAKGTRSTAVRGIIGTILISAFGQP